MTRADFIVSSSNYRAVEAVDSFPDNAAPFCILYGPEGCGKSHLLTLWRQRTGDPEAGMDDADRRLPGDRAAQEDLFHRYNRTRQAGGGWLLTARTPPSEWNLELPDLVSRLRACPAVEIGQPDDMLLEAVLWKLFADRQIKPPRQIIIYLLKRMERSIAEAEKWVSALDARALAEGRPASLRMIRDMMSEEESSRQYNF